MKAHTFLALSAALLVLALPRPAAAEGTTAAQFLNISIGARSFAMGEAYVAIADDPSALYWNPAGLTAAKNVDAMVTHSFWLLDMSYQHAGAVLPTGIGHFALGVTYSSSGEIPKIDNLIRVGEYSAYDGAVELAYARNILHGLAVGVTGRYIFQKIENFSAETFAADVGILWEVDALDGLRFGFAAQNVGPGMKFIEQSDPLPLRFRLGAALARDEYALALELDKTRDADVRFGIGGEYVVLNTLAVRAGYSSSRTYSAGIGVMWKMLELGYAFVPHPDIESAHVISLRLRL